MMVVRERQPIWCTTFHRTNRTAFVSLGESSWCSMKFTFKLAIPLSYKNYNLVVLTYVPMSRKNYEKVVEAGTSNATI